MGLIAQQQAGLQMVAAAARLGRVSANQLLALADLAEQYGDASLRMTPWQGLLLPNIPSAAADAVLQALAELGLLTDARPSPETVAIAMEHAMEGAGTNEDLLFRFTERMDRDEIAAFLRKLQGFGGHRTTVIALRLLLLTFVRTIEMRKAEWTEVDLAAAEWRIPAEKM